MTPERKAARELIAFYLDAGVDAFLGEEPINRMADDLARTKNTARGKRIASTAGAGAVTAPAKASTGRFSAAA
jgi:hypothetical protein